MKKLFIYSLLIFQFFNHFSSWGSSLQTDIVIGTVIDEAGAPVQNMKVSVEGSEYFTSGADGKFKVISKKKLTMPFDVLVDKKGFQMVEFTFSDSDNEIEVIVKKVGRQEEEQVTVRFFDENDEVIKNAVVTIDGINYVADVRGNVLVKNHFTEKSKISIDGYELSGISFNKKEKFYKITEHKKVIQNPQVTEDNTISPVTNSLSDTIPKKSLNEQVFEQYKGDFDELTNEIIAERIRVEGNNKKIRDEIVAITNRLQNEKNLTKEQRKELHRYVEKLENTLLENTIAFQKSQERTNFLISKLKNIIMEKDSINLKALERIKVVEKENRITERKFKRNLIVFSIITCALLMLAVVFYSIAIKMKKQRRELLKANEEMHGIKDQLTQSLLEVKKQNELIESQKKQLAGHS